MPLSFVNGQNTSKYVVCLGGVLHVMAGVCVSGLVQLLHFGMTSFFDTAQHAAKFRSLKTQNQQDLFSQKAG